MLVRIVILFLLAMALLAMVSRLLPGGRRKKLSWWERWRLRGPSLCGRCGRMVSAGETCPCEKKG